MEYDLFVKMHWHFTLCNLVCKASKGVVHNEYRTTMQNQADSSAAGASDAGGVRLLVDRGVPQRPRV